MTRTTITIAGFTLAIVSSALHAAPIASLRAGGNADQATTKTYYYRSYYARPSYRPHYRPYNYNSYYIPYYYYGCRRFYSWGYLHCVW